MQGINEDRRNEDRRNEERGDQRPLIAAIDETRIDETKIGVTKNAVIDFDLALNARGLIAEGSKPTAINVPCMECKGINEDRRNE